MCYFKAQTLRNNVTAMIVSDLAQLLESHKRNYRNIFTGRVILNKTIKLNLTFKSEERDNPPLSGRHLPPVETMGEFSLQGRKICVI